MSLVECRQGVVAPPAAFVSALLFDFTPMLEEKRGEGEVGVDASIFVVLGVDRTKCPGQRGAPPEVPRDVGVNVNVAASRDELSRHLEHVRRRVARQNMEDATVVWIRAIDEQRFETPRGVETI